MDPGVGAGLAVRDAEVDVFLVAVAVPAGRVRLPPTDRARSSRVPTAGPPRVYVGRYYYRKNAMTRPTRQREREGDRQEETAEDEAESIPDDADV